MAGTLITVSDAFRAALVAQGNTGTNAHKVVSIGLATAAFDATNKKLTKLPNELKRITTFGGQNISADTIHVTLLDDSADQFSLFGFGFYLEDGTLAAYYSQAAAIMEKSPAAQLLLSVDTQFASIDAATLSFPAASFLNPPASETVQGVIELATQAETDAGTDDLRAITPKKAAARYAPQKQPTFTGPVTINGNSTVTGTSTVNGALSVNGSSIVNGNATVTGSAALASTSGRVTIGAITDDGTNKLQVAGNARTYGTQTAGGAGTVTAWVSADANFGYFRTAGSASIGSENANGFADILAGGAARVRVLPSGRVLMGQTASDDGANTLQVTGTIKGIAAQRALIASNGSGTGQTSLMLSREGAAVDEKQWEILSGSDGAFTLRALNDAYTNSSNAIIVRRPPGGGINLTSMQLMQAGGRVIVGPTSDDGTNALQVNGTSRAANYVINSQSANDSGLVGIYNGANGPNVAFYGANTSGAGALTMSTGGGERARINAAGRLLLGTTTDNGFGLMQVAGQISQRADYAELRMNAAAATNKNAWRLASTINGAGNDGYLVVQHSNDNYGSNFTNSVTFQPSGRVLVGTSTDDGSNLFQVAGTGKFNSRVYVANTAGDAATVHSAPAGQFRFVQFQTNGVRRVEIGTNADTESGNGSNSGSNVYLNTFDDAGNYLASPLLITRATSTVSIGGRTLMGTTSDDGVNRLQVNGNARITGRTLIGQTTDNGSSALQITGEIQQTNASHVIATYGNYQSYRTRAAAGSAAAPTAIAAGTQLGGLNVAGYNGSAYGDVATVSAWSESAFTSTSMASQLRLYTTPSGSTVQNERVRIVGAGRVLINTQTDDGTTQLQVAGTAKANGVAASNNGMTIDNGAGWGTFWFNNNGKARWTINKKNDAATGGNSGDSLTINAFADDAVTQNEVININRASLVTAFTKTPTAPTAAAGDVSSQLSTTQFVATALLNAHVGQIVYEPRTSVRASYLKLNGAVVNRADYPALWAYAQASGALVTDAAWGSGSQGCFSSGDGANTFRIPELRGEFLRCWDDGRGVDGGRTLGSWQDSQNRSHAHGASAAAVGDHAHTAWTDSQGFHGHGVTDNGHAHGIPQGSSPGTDASTVAGPGSGRQRTSQTDVSGSGISINGDGSHGHNVGINGAGGHSHAITINADGGNETRVRNVAMLAMIRAF
ncbi:hypothetical protein B0G62_12266 [Paraburkholderia eburnea]|uniref:Microcystin-dependent protein n=1 Tax=Paraburkholderia eburnea TaxID=1189126 RepID=A0A2S4LWD3_9BURK|nr:phage tail protein [Paraburkholderia eburnea]POR46750.1 hypothetical protein B0G62_12266 [Paraburkholderia eburnea]PRZ17939.1 hypothetical protein BX588_12266 [Paraburkholderia eburnea]